MYDFDKLLNRIGTCNNKWDRSIQETGREDIIPMPVADMDFICLPEITEALIKRASHPAYGYSYSDPKIVDSIISWNKRRHDLELPRENVKPICGVLAALDFMFKKFTQPGDKILLQVPVYYPFFHLIRRNNCQLVTSPLINNNEYYEMDFEDLEKKLSQGVRAMILCSPHNPIGRVWTPEELKKVVQLCAKYNVYLFCDEIHCDLVFAGHEFTSVLKIAQTEEEKDLVIVTSAPSKTFNIAGIPSSYMVCLGKNSNEKMTMNAFEYEAPKMFAAAATIAAYDNGDRWVDELNVYLKKNNEYIYNYFTEKMPRVKCRVNEATYLLMLDFSAYGIEQNELYWKFIKEGGVKLQSLTPQDWYVPHDGFFRMNFGTQMSLIEKAMDGIYKAIGE